MHETLKSNFIESIKGAQKSLFVGCVLSVLLFVFAKNGKVDPFVIPELGITASGEVGLFIIFVLYAATGLMLLFFLSRANRNLKKISDADLRDALVSFPSFACGSWYTRISACFIPVALFAIAMQEAFRGNIGVIYLMVFIFSAPYLAAASMAVEVKA